MTRRVLIISGLVSLGLIISLVVGLIRNSQSASTAYHGSWTLTALTIGGQAYPLVPQHPVTLAFATQQRIQGNAGCNAYGASYAGTAPHIAITDLAATAMGCLGPEGNLETHYLQGLLQAQTVHLTGTTLLLESADGQARLSFAPTLLTM
jgi:heat shock protein HslJ